MSDKHAGRIEQTAENKQQVFSQPWTPQTMRAQYDYSQTDNQLPQGFPTVHLVDGRLEGTASVSQPKQNEYQSDYSQPGRREPQRAHHYSLNGAASDGQRNHTATANHKHVVTDYLSGRIVIPASNTPDGPIASETLSAKFPAANYHEGQSFSGVLWIPAEKGKQHYYNGLANARYENGYLKGIPVHMENGIVKSHLQDEIDIELRRNR